MLIVSRQARFRFFGALNDFLPPDRQETPIPLSFNSGQSVKHLVESLGVPHTEIQRIHANEQVVDFGYLVEDGDLVDVYPLTGQASNPSGSNEHRFVVDNHLGRLAVYLRMLGFDTLYRNDYQDAELARVSEQEERTLLTRDRRLLMRNQVTQGYCVRDTVPRQQLAEVVVRFGLRPDVAPFRRCMRCNGLLEPVAKETILDRLQPLTRRYFDEFRICTQCDQVYWKGSHYERMQRLIDQVLQEKA